MGTTVDLKKQLILKQPTDLVFCQDLRLLDQQYLNSKQVALTSSVPINQFVAELNKDLQDQVESLTWFSYRQGFEVPLIYPYALKREIGSDAGWGCMIRCGQMMLCQAIKRHMFEQFSF